MNSVNILHINVIFLNQPIISLEDKILIRE